MGMIRSAVTFEGVVAVRVVVYKTQRGIQEMMHQRREMMGHWMVTGIESGADGAIISAACNRRGSRHRRTTAIISAAG